MIDEMPEAEKRIFGMDFGYSNDPTTLMEIRQLAGDLYIDQLIYQRALTTPEIIKLMKAMPLGNKEIVADNEDPRMIAELQLAGFNVIPATKGPDSVAYGINAIKSRKLFVTKRSLDTIRELRNYKYKQNRNGETTNEPVDIWNHAIDAIRYPVMHLERHKTPGGGFRATNIKVR
jgi:phage terminase large subunit